MVTHDELKTFFLEMRRGTYKCDFCTSEVFAASLGAPVGGVEMAARLALLTQPTHPPGSPGFHGFYSISCTNCGKSTFFHENQVMQWKARRTGGVGR